MKHYIIVKFKNNFNYKSEVKNIKEIFNKTKAIDGVEDVQIKCSNSMRENRFDLMIEISLSYEGLQKYDISDAHHEWKNKYAEYIESKTIFDCD